MQIEAENCQGLSDTTDVIGVRLVPEYQSTSPQPQTTTKLPVAAASTLTNFIIVIIFAIVAVALILVVFVIIHQKGKVKNILSLKINSKIFLIEL